MNTALLAPKVGLTPSHPELPSAWNAYSHPAVDLAMGDRFDDSGAFASQSGAQPSSHRADHTMRAVYLHLQQPGSLALPPQQAQAALKAFAEDPIAGAPFDNPVLAADGFTYSLATIRGWWQTQVSASRAITSPMTNTAVTDMRLIPNSAMRAMMADLGLEGSHSPNPRYDEALRYPKQKPARAWSALELDYTRNAPPLLATSDARLQDLSTALAEPHSQPHGFKQTLRAIQAQAQVKALFLAPKFRPVNEMLKIYRAVDLQLQLGHLHQADVMVRRGLALNPKSPILLARQALICALREDVWGAQSALCELFDCSTEAAPDALQHFVANEARHRSAWPLLAAAGLLFEGNAGDALLPRAARRFPSRLLNRFLSDDDEA